MLVSDIIEHFAATTPYRDAVVDRGREFSYAWLQGRIVRRAAVLTGLGVRHGDRVAALATDCAEHLELICALSRIGATWVPVNHRLTAPEVAHILQDSQAIGLYFTPEHRSVVEELRDVLGELWLEPLEPLTNSGSDHLPPKDPGVPSEAPFCIMYTSGTTGRPKGAVLTHRQFVNGAYYLKSGIGFTARDRLLLGLPQFHAGGAIYQFAHLLAGATVVLTPRFDPDLVERTAATHGVTTLALVPTMMHALADRGEPFLSHVPTLRRILYGGSPVDPTVLQQMIANYPVEFVQTYGQTEAGVIVTVLDGADHHKALTEGNYQLLASCGRPLLGYRVQLGAGSEGGGEVMVRSESVMSGYWRQPEATKAALVDDWLHTGDVGQWDENGYLFIVDRLSALIISGGENVYPLEVERVLAGHPQVHEVAVVGVPDKRWGEVVKAVVVAAGLPPGPDELREYCRGKIAGFKIPKLFEYVPLLPRNAAGKVTKHRLRG